MVLQALTVLLEAEFGFTTLEEPTRHTSLHVRNREADTKRRVDARGGNEVNESRAQRAQEVEGITRICGSRVGVLGSKRTIHLQSGSLNAHLHAHAPAKRGQQCQQRAAAQLGRQILATHYPARVRGYFTGSWEPLPCCALECCDDHGVELQELVGAKPPAGASAGGTFKTNCDGASLPLAPRRSEEAGVAAKSRLTLPTAMVSGQAWIWDPNHPLSTVIFRAIVDIFRAIVDIAVYTFTQVSMYLDITSKRTTIRA